MTELLAVITITILAVISPGPDFAMVTRNSLLGSRSTGLWTALGIGCGVLVHVAYTLLGVGLIIQQSLLLFNLLKLLGAAYLVWLGVKMLRSKAPSAAAGGSVLQVSALRAFKIGFLTNALNPKTTIFVVSLFLQVVGPDTPLIVQLCYGAFISLAHIVWFTLVALFFSASTIQARIIKARQWIDRAFGCLLILFGGILASATLR